MAERLFALPTDPGPRSLTRPLLKELASVSLLLTSMVSMAHMQNNIHRAFALLPDPESRSLKRPWTEVWAELFSEICGLLVNRTRCPNNVVCWWAEAIILWQISLNGGRPYLGGLPWVAEVSRQEISVLWAAAHSRAGLPLYCPPRKFPTLGKGKITDLRSPGQPGKSSQKRSTCSPEICEIFQNFCLSSISVPKWKTALSKIGRLFHKILHLKEKKNFLNAMNFPCACMCELLWKPSEFKELLPVFSEILIMYVDTGL